MGSPMKHQSLSSRLSTRGGMSWPARHTSWRRSTALGQRVPPSLVVFLAFVFFALGCGGEADGGADSRQAESPTLQEPSPPISDAADRDDAAQAQPPQTPPSSPAPTIEIGVPQSGNAGSIGGAIKSPYIRLARAVVFIEEVKDVQFDIPEQTPIMGQRNKIFEPNLLPVLVGTTVDFTNNDDVKHNVYSRPASAATFNLGEYEPGVVKKVAFDAVGITRLGCRIHAEMSGYVITLQNPFFALTERDGSFTISDVPPGRYRLSYFHERIQEAPIEVTVQPGAEAVVEFTNLKRK